MLQLGRFPRVRLAHVPTLLDDCTGLTRTRKLEYVVADALCSGKAMAGLLDLVRQDRFNRDESIAA